MYLLKHKKTSTGITLDTLIRIKFCCLNFGRMAEPCAVRGRLGQHMRLEPDRVLEQPTCLFFDLAEHAEEGRLHSMAV